MFIAAASQPADLLAECGIDAGKDRRLRDPRKAFEQERWKVLGCRL